MKVPGKSRGGPKRGYLDGQMLIAMPAMGDERFARSLIYVCAHSSEGAMGIVVNQPAANIKFPDLLVQLDVIPAAELIQLPRKATCSASQWRRSARSRWSARPMPKRRGRSRRGNRPSFRGGGRRPRARNP